MRKLLHPNLYRRGILMKLPTKFQMRCLTISLLITTMPIVQ